ncbi:MAG: RlmE family RNA methyltransferase [Spirochaetales bacterium]
MRKLNDHWTQQAKKEGYPARSVYKLQEIDQKYHLLKGVKSVLDIGASPGSWTLYLLRHLSPSAHVVAVDLKPLALASHPNLTFIQGDITEPSLQETLAKVGPFDLIVSDAAPATTGSRTVDTARSEALVEAILSLVSPLVIEGGAGLVKIFQGSERDRIIEKMKNLFEITRILKPKASRKESFELFVLGLGKKE